ncbi:hypothetical protein [Halanaerobium hydrogeniformans]|uniref:Uncharacterized protein n=1 Tax=Halanaerobium hydrogeniformans TaxID=656519 RepID=E4RK91_HALHG|nr:hypothetical protein [Halanaerobium hydrogeniformans]ADQ14643.1 hypothetical protein Halsa_1212 [Halanaerobium hydrogeniformans]
MNRLILYAFIGAVSATVINYFNLNLVTGAIAAILIGSTAGILMHFFLNKH